ncbi:MAG: hypothetical protein QW100_02295, partial [Thermoplasmatales archaeon]
MKKLIICLLCLLPFILLPTKASYASDITITSPLYLQTNTPIGNSSGYGYTYYLPQPVAVSSVATMSFQANSAAGYVKVYDDAGHYIQVPVTTGNSSYTSVTITNVQFQANSLSDIDYVLLPEAGPLGDLIQNILLEPLGTVPTLTLSSAGSVVVDRTISINGNLSDGSQPLYGAYISLSVTGGTMDSYSPVTAQNGNYTANFTANNISGTATVTATFTWASGSSVTQTINITVEPPIQITSPLYLQTNTPIGNSSGYGYTYYLPQPVAVSSVATMSFQAN